MSDVGRLTANAKRSWTEAQSTWAEAAPKWRDQKGHQFSRNYWDSISSSCPKIIATLDEIKELIRQSQNLT